jgi:hypothetical protein
MTDTLASTSSIKRKNTGFWLYELPFSLVLVLTVFGGCLHHFHAAADQSLLGTPGPLYLGGLHRRGLAKRKRQRRAIASGGDASAALARIPDRHKHDAVVAGAEKLQRQRNRARDFYISVARDVHGRCASPVLAGLLAWSGHGARHTGPCLGRKLRTVFPAGSSRRLCNPCCALVALARTG